MFTQIKKINDSIAMIRLGSLDSNIYVVNKELLVDAGTGLHKKLLEDALRSLRINFNSIQRIVHTHCHFDHVGGNRHFPKAKIALQKEDAAVLEARDIIKSYAIFFGSTLKNIKKADIKLADGEIIKSKKLKLKVIHTPGHTLGSICLYDEKEQILFSGDTVFASTVGRTDLLGSNYADLKDSLLKLSQLKIKKILPGHGSIVSSGGTAHINNLLKGI